MKTPWIEAVEEKKLHRAPVQAGETVFSCLLCFPLASLLLLPRKRKGFVLGYKCHQRVRFPTVSELPSWQHRMGFNSS